jgi:hypothetical protein
MWNATLLPGRPSHHVDRITFDIKADVSAVDDVVSGKMTMSSGRPRNLRLDSSWVTTASTSRNLWVAPGDGARMFFLNTRDRCSRTTPSSAGANFAVDRRALAREYGRYAATATDQYLPSAVGGFKGERIYPLQGPNLRRARALANGHRRSGKAVLYTCSDPTRPDCIGVPQVLQRNLEAIGIEVESRVPFRSCSREAGCRASRRPAWVRRPSVYRVHPGSSGAGLSSSLVASRLPAAPAAFPGRAVQGVRRARCQLRERSAASRRESNAWAFVL